MSTGAPLPKGYRTEEMLREYFLRLGYYVVRGAKVKIGNLEGTDVDLWLYQRVSALGRDRINVDIKDKARAKAAERIFWAKGVQSLLGLERSIVATTDRRPEIKQFANDHGILLLDGDFLSRIAVGLKPSARLTDEGFEEICFGKGDGALFDGAKARYTRLKSLVLTDLDFDGCNTVLNEIHAYLERALISTSQRGAGLRLLYFATSVLLVCADYASRLLTFEDPAVSRQVFVNGFRYGSRGAERLDEAFRVASGLVETFAPDLRARIHDARGKALAHAASAFPTEILAEFFARPENHRELVQIARAFEDAAFASTLSMPSALSSPCQSVLGVLADYFGVERKQILGLE